MTPLMGPEPGYCFGVGPGASGLPRPYGSCPDTPSGICVILCPALRKAFVSSAIDSRLASDDSLGVVFIVRLVRLLSFLQPLSLSLLLLSDLALSFFKRIISFSHF